VTGRRTLLVLRHAQTEDARPGGHDIDRRLTLQGEEQARAVGAFLREAGLAIDCVLCSSAVRARQTLELLDLPPLAADHSDVSEAYYNAGSDSLIEAVRTLPDSCDTALVVGHAPGLPGAAYELVDPESSDPSAWAAIEHRFPAAGLARLEWDGGWDDVGAARLVGVRLPDGG
jgi:phosphohistidine phosphatase